MLKIYTCMYRHIHLLLTYLLMEIWLFHTDQLTNVYNSSTEVGKYLV